VLGILERGGKVRTRVAGDRRTKTLQAEVHKQVPARRSTPTNVPVLRDWPGRTPTKSSSTVCYVDGEVHTKRRKLLGTAQKRSSRDVCVRRLVPSSMSRRFGSTRTAMKDFDRSRWHSRGQ
jgi:hypothetical protein